MGRSAATFPQFFLNPARVSGIKKQGSQSETSTGWLGKRLKSSFLVRLFDHGRGPGVELLILTELKSIPGTWRRNFTGLVQTSNP